MTSEQHKDTTTARQKRDFKDVQTLVSFLTTRDPFSDDRSLRSITSGVAADDNVDADKAEETGMNPTFRFL